nr:DUF4878 domain-containing protein [Tsukamurella sp. PLM1]
MDHRGGCRGRGTRRRGGAAAGAALGRRIVGRPRRAAADATTSFVAAVNRGDLAALREQTCGGAKAYYDGVDEAQWQRIHAAAKTDGMLPEVDGLQAVDVRGDRAEVQVEVHYVNNPESKVRNTLSLEKNDGTWKVCTRVGAR